MNDDFHAIINASFDAVRSDAENEMIWYRFVDPHDDPGTFISVLDEFERVVGVLAQGPQVDDDGRPMGWRLLNPRDAQDGSMVKLPKNGITMHFTMLLNDKTMIEVFAHRYGTIDTLVPEDAAPDEEGTQPNEDPHAA